MKPRPFALAAALLVAGCSQTITIEDRLGATIAQARADHAECHEEVERAPDMYIPPQPTLAGAAGAGAIAGVSSVIQEEKAVAVCMQRRGYVSRILTPEETEAVRSTPRSAARDAVLNAIMKADDPVSTLSAEPSDG